MIKFKTFGFGVANKYSISEKISDIKDRLKRGMLGSSHFNKEATCRNAGEK